MRNWFQDTFYVPLDVVDDGTMRFPEHPERTFQAIRWFLHDLTDWELGMIILSTRFGSYRDF